MRRITTRSGKATAEYEIAPLPDGRFALKYGFSYHCGDWHGHSTPWATRPTRGECLSTFLSAAREHFGIPLGGSPCDDGNDTPHGHPAQREARRKMLALLDDIHASLFFVEPEPEKPGDEPDHG